MVLGVPKLKHFRVYCDPSLESSQSDGSNDGSQNLFLWRNMANYP